MSDPRPKKELGQNWLKDPAILDYITDEAEITPEDFVLEIGPGLGTLTEKLLNRTENFLAVEYDMELYEKLKTELGDKIVNEDFLQFNLNNLPQNYKVVANIPYYITNKIVQKLLTAENKPSKIVLLVQKEVAERLAAKPGQMSILGISSQLYSDVKLGEVIPASYFTPAPKVDSQVVIMDIKNQKIDINEKEFFRVVKAGFANRRKKLRSSLSAGLAISKQDTEKLLQKVNIDSNLRAQDLTIYDWQKLALALQDC